MEFYDVFIGTLKKLLEAASVPQWLTDTILKTVEVVLPEEKAVEIENDLKQFLATQLLKVADANPTSVLTEEVVAYLVQELSTTVVAKAD